MKASNKQFGDRNNLQITESTAHSLKDIQIQVYEKWQRYKRDQRHDSKYLTEDKTPKTINRDRIKDIPFML